ncbi:MAG TPA: acyl-CoA desaturase [Actinomycetota bacterium]|nr:acyl-CoA desaturase [Actinomycetota bacterium]
MSQVISPAPPRPAPKPITERHSGRTLKLERRLTLLVTILPFAGAAIGIPLLWNHGVKALDLTLFFVFYVFTGMGITVGFHRMLTHRSFETVKPVKLALAIAGSMAIQGAVVSWVADHRRHHAFADKPGDPHSPHLAEAEGIKGILAGLWHAHTGWFFNPEKTNIKKFAPDLIADKSILKVSRTFPLWATISIVLPGLIGLVITRSWMGGLTALIWGGLARIFFLHHVTWSINSICHFYGSRPFKSKDESTNNWIMALLSFGEGWHNSHHAFPTSYKHGLGRFQFDPSAWFISGLKVLGLARNIKMPTMEQMAAKRTSPASS